jgi:hypothetical protein
MKLIDAVLAEPELRDRPPVLVDIGAAGGIHPAWTRLARRSIGVGFEPDARDRAALSSAQSTFKQWFFCPGLATPVDPPPVSQRMYLTRSPQCSSTLRPLTAELSPWAFADLFEVVELRDFPASSVRQALDAHGLDRIDWLKCDTQGIDLQLYLSLPETWRQRMLAAEFEPGLIDVYDGEDTTSDVLRAMSREPFWLTDMEVNRTPRGPRPILEKYFPNQARRYARFGPSAPGWCNLRYLRDLKTHSTTLNRRELLLLWAIASLTEQHGYALEVAEFGAEHFPAPLFSRLAQASVKSVRRAMTQAFLRRIWAKLTRRA